MNPTVEELRVASEQCIAEGPRPYRFWEQLFEIQQQEDPHPLATIVLSLFVFAEKKPGGATYLEALQAGYALGSHVERNRQGLVELERMFK